MSYDFKRVEKKWAQKWVESSLFTPDLNKAKNPYYALFMFPYPSAEGLHIGNFYAFTCVDVIAKYKKLKGMDVFEPFGFDAFGIHSENYALTIGESPRKMLSRTEANFRKQIISAGLGCDWNREVNTTHPGYYKWTQWIFLKLFEKGLAFQKEAFLNWCPSCKTVLADEQIEEGACERCGSVPEKKNLRQWFFKITDYGQRLLDGLDDMNWSDITKAAQRNWIGRSEGAEVDFIINEKKISVFTTRPDTLFGCTYFVLSPEHPLVKEVTTKEQKIEVQEYVKKAGSKSELDRIEAKEKTGVFTGSYAVNPINNEKIPVWIADYVLMGYGTGAIMAVPAHDERDYDFSRENNLPLREVVKGGNIKEGPFVGDGKHINSQFLNGLKNSEAIRKAIEWLEKKKLGREKVNYKLRDWCISRQRYWGPPVPIIYCRDCGVVPVPEEDLPVVLPVLEKGWEPAGDGKGPLDKIGEFVNTKCPHCKKEAKRETDVMDNFLDSAWYFFRYLSPREDREIFDKKIGKKWLPVDIYIGGNEHAVLHLMYTRFITMFFHDIGLVDFDNPFKVFRANGMILKDGKKMSKSKGNIVNPEEWGESVGYDALKSYLLFLGPLEENKSFSDRGILGTKRWIEKIAHLEEKVVDNFSDEKQLIQEINSAIRKVEKDIEEQKYNTAIACLMEITNMLTTFNQFSKKTWMNFLALIAPFTPALAEEMWERAGQEESIFRGKNWPEFSKKLINEKKINLIIQVDGKLKDMVVIDVGKEEEEIKKIAIESKKVKKQIGDKKIEKIIVIKDKLVNIVTKKND